MFDTNDIKWDQLSVCVTVLESLTLLAPRFYGSIAYFFSFSFFPMVS